MVAPVAISENVVAVFFCLVCLIFFPMSTIIKNIIFPKHNDDISFFAVIFHKLIL